jgi:hypothetical protein
MKSQNGIILAVTLIGLLAIGCQNTNVNNIPERVVMKYIYLDTLTPIDISCDSFEIYFKQDVSTLTVTGEQFLDSLASILDVLRPSPDSFMPDVRLVMQIYYPKNKTQELCMGRTALELDGVAMEFEPRLLSLLKSEVKRHGKQLDSN